MRTASSATVVRSVTGRTSESNARTELTAVAVLAIALALAAYIYALQLNQPQSERAVVETAAVLVLILAAVAGGSLVWVRTNALPGTAGLVFLATCSTAASGEKAESTGAGR